MAEALPIPAKLAATVVQWSGDHGRSWLDGLPSLVAWAEAEWALELGPPFEPGGNISWVAPARRADGTAAALKVQLPDVESEPEAAGLRAWAGDGAVRLLEHDESRRVLLVERCEPGDPIVDQGGTIDAVRAAAEIGRRLHSVSIPSGIPTLGDLLDAWAIELEERRARVPVVDHGLVDLALEVMRTRPRATTRPVLLHGDLNPTNLLAAQREPWLAIDPKPLVGDPAWDGPRLVLQPDPFDTPDPAATFARRLDLVAHEMGVDREGLVLYCLVTVVEMGAWGRDMGDEAMAEACDAQVALVRPHLP